MAWIESHQELLRHFKTRKLMASMGWDVYTTIGRLHAFWWWCMDFAPDGDLSRHDAPLLADAVGLTGKDSKKFVKAMIHAGFLDSEPYLRPHDWWKYAGPFLQRRYRRDPETWKRTRDSYEPGKSTNPGSRPDESCTFPPDQPDQTNPTIYNQNHHLPDRRQHEPAHNANPRQGPDADSAGPKGATIQHSCNEQIEFLQGIPNARGVAGYDFDRIIGNRIGRDPHLSRRAIVRLEVMKARYGSDFLAACDTLHSGVTHPMAYLQAVLDPDNKSRDFARRLDCLVEKSSAPFKQKGFS